MRFEVLTAVKLTILVYWVVKTSSEDKTRYVSPKRWYLPPSPRSVATWETNVKKFRIVFLDVLPCKIIVDRRFRGTCCLHHQDDESHLYTLKVFGIRVLRKNVLLLSKRLEGSE
jgi:hypothetical protein